MSKPLILLVDDELGLLKLFGHVLDQLDVELIQAEGGAAAIDMLAERVPNLLILDLAMPEVDGADVLRYINGEPRLAAMKVMILSARLTDPSIEDLGIDSWVTKPVLPKPFLAEVKKLL